MHPRRRAILVIDLEANIVGACGGDVEVEDWYQERQRFSGWIVEAYDFKARLLGAKRRLLPETAGTSEWLPDLVRANQSARICKAHVMLMARFNKGGPWQS